MELWLIRVGMTVRIAAHGHAWRPARSSHVPRYYFNVRSDSSEVTDVVGESCADDVAALSKAFHTASAVVQNRLLANEINLGGWVEVEDERHRPVLRLPLRAAAY
jgi:hypothetical protein